MNFSFGPCNVLALKVKEILLVLTPLLLFCRPVFPCNPFGRSSPVQATSHPHSAHCTEERGKLVHGTWDIYQHMKPGNANPSNNYYEICVGGASHSQQQLVYLNNKITKSDSSSCMVVAFARLVCLPIHILPAHLQRQHQLHLQGGKWLILLKIEIRF